MLPICSRLRELEQKLLASQRTRRSRDNNAINTKLLATRSFEVSADSFAIISAPTISTSPASGITRTLSLFMLVQYGGILDQRSTRIVTCSSIAIPGLRDARSGS